MATKNRKTQLEISADATGVEVAAQKAADAIKGVGASADETARNVANSSNSIVNAIKRQATETQKAIAEVDAGNRTSVAFFENFARQRGVDVEAIRPLLNALSDVRAAYDSLLSKQKESANTSLFEQQHAAAKRLVQDAEYVNVWTTALDRKDAAERASAATLLFEQQHIAAKRLVQDSEYVNFWVQALDRKEAAERQAGVNSTFLSSLKSQSDAIGKTRADLLEMQAAQMGLTAQAAPFIAKLRESEGALRKSGIAFNEYGLSAKQTSAALRQVPAQLTDIFVSLQGGQAPLTVLLQQGGQLKDVFGGIVPAAKALGSAVLGLINPFTVAAAAIGGIAYAYSKGASESKAFENTLILSGRAAGVTAGQLSDMAAAIDRIGGGTQAKAAEVLNKIAGTSLIGAQNMQKFAQASIEFERAGGSAAEKTVEAFTELGKAPLQASLKLNESMGYLTRSTYEQIKALEDQGNTVEAARVAQEAYADSITSRTPELERNLGSIERAWQKISDKIKEVGDEWMNIGRDTTVGAQIGLQQATVARLRAAAANNAVASPSEWIKSLQGQSFTQQADEAQKLVDHLKAGAALQAKLAQDGAAHAKQVGLAAAYAKENEKSLSASEKLNLEITRLTVQGLAAGEKMEQIQKNIAAARERAAKAGSKGGSSNNRELEAEADLLARLSGLTTTYNNDIERLNSARARGRITEEQYGEAVRALVALQPFAVQAERDLATAAKEKAKALEDATRAQEKNLAGLDKTIEANEKTLDGLRLELIELTQGKAAREEVIQQRLDDAAAQAEQNAQLALMGDFNEYERLVRIAAQLREVAAARRGVAEATASNEAEEANRKAAEKAQAEWEKAADQIGQSLADNLMKGGKDAAEYIKDLFRTMVLRPIIQAATQPAANATLGLLGMGGSGSALASGGGSSSLSMLGSLGGLGGAFSSFGTGMAYGGASGLAGGLTGASAMIGSGNVAMGMGAGFGAVAPYLAAAYAVYAIAKSMDDSGTPHVGSVVSGSGLNLSTLMGDDSGITNNYNASTDAALRGIVGSSTGILNALGGGGYSATAKFAADNTDASIGQYILGRNGSIAGTVGTATSLTGGGDYAKYTSDATAGLEAFTADIVRLTREQLDTLDLPGWARDQLDNLGSDADLTQLAGVANAIEATITALDNLRDAFGPLGGVFENIAGLSSDALYSLAESSGGLDALGASLGTFFQNFYDEGERAAMQTAAMTAALGDVGLALPESRDAFRDLVEGLNLTSESGREQFAVLMEVSGAFAELNPIIEATTDAVDQSALALARMTENFNAAMAGLASDSAGLEVELLRAGGDETGARALARSQFLGGQDVTEEQRAAIAAVYDYNQGIRDQITALERAAVVGQERAGLELQLLQLQGDTLAIRELERDALDESNRGIYDRITALQDEQAATAEAKRLADEATAAALAEAQRIAGLVQTLDQAARGAIGAFQTPEQQRGQQFKNIAEDLQRAGVFGGVADLGDILSESTKQQIFDFANAFVKLEDVTLESKIAVVNAAGALAGLSDAAVNLARDIEAAGLQSQLDEIAAVFGDLSVIEDPVKSLSATYLENKDAIQSLEDGLDQLLGTVELTVQQTLANLRQTQTALAGARANLAQAIEEASLRGMTPEGRVSALKQREVQLFGELATTSDPVGVANRLQQVVLARIKEEAGLRATYYTMSIDGIQQQIDLTEEARRAQLDALREQIDGLVRLKRLAEDIAQFTGSMRFSDISPLSPEAQLNAARSLFEGTLQSAIGGDADAQSNLTGNAKAYLDEARSYFASSAAYADIFNSVLGSLDQLGLTAGSVDPQIAALEAQADRLENLSQTVIDTSAEEVAALTAIDTALAARADENKVAIEAQTQAAKDQIAEQKLINEGIRAQLVQAAARHQEIKQQLQDLNDKVQRQLENEDLVIAAPA